MLTPEYPRNRHTRHISYFTPDDRSTLILATSPLLGPADGSVRLFRSGGKKAGINDVNLDGYRPTPGGAQKARHGACLGTTSHDAC